MKVTYEYDVRRATFPNGDDAAVIAWLNSFGTESWGAIQLDRFPLRKRRRLTGETLYRATLERCIFHEEAR